MIICFDIDNTICENKKFDQSYANVKPFPEMLEFMNYLHNNGHYIILQTARHMKTCNGNVGKVLARRGKELFDWLEKYNIPYDEIYFGKPHADFFIDDKAISYDGNNLDVIKLKLGI